MSGLPCNHAVGAIYKAEMHPEDFVSPFLKKEMYLASYKPVFNPMPAEHGKYTCVPSIPHTSKKTVIPKNG
jgi:hypothetical protein